MNFLKTLIYKRNKILAITFSSLAIITFVAFFAVNEIQSGWTYFRTNPLSIITLLFRLLVYGTIFITNVRNDNYAYQGILWFVFYIALNALLDIIQNIFLLSFDPIAILMYSLYFSFTGGELVLGIFLYVNILKYMRGLSIRWGKIRLLAILFASVLTLEVIGFYLPFFLMGAVSLASMLTIPLSEAFIGWAIVFTLERLRRI